MESPSGDFILRKIREAKITEFKPQFSLDALVNKTISGWRQIKNPKKYDPEIESANPEYFNVVLFSDNTFLVTENRGDGGCSHLHSYFYDGEKIHYSDQLFGSA